MRNSKLIRDKKALFDNELRLAKFIIQIAISAFIWTGRLQNGWLIRHG